MNGDDLDLENPRHFVEKQISNKPNDGDPKTNIKMNAERKKMMELRRKHQQDKEKERLDAIENKIERARKRLEEKNKKTSENAKNTRPTMKRRTAPASGQYNKSQHQKNNYMESDDEFNDDPKDQGLGLYIGVQNHKVKGDMQKMNL